MATILGSDYIRSEWVTKHQDVKFAINCLNIITLVLQRASCGNSQ
jgi:hypothetical protein